jgi:hypothetical protein
MPASRIRTAAPTFFSFLWTALASALAIEEPLAGHAFSSAEAENGMRSEARMLF